MRYTLQFLGCIVFLSMQAAYPHHTRSVHFDLSKLITIKGTVIELQLINPHARIYLDVTNDAGDIERWTVEMAGKLALARRGWTDDTLSTGDRITVTGNPSHTGKPALWWQRIILEDGTELLDPLLKDVLDIDKQRRQKALDQSRK